MSNLINGKLVLIGTIGLPGSGKSTFLRRFSEEQNIFYWNNDDVRRHIYDKPQHTPVEHELLGRTSRHVFEQLLSIGVSIAYDVNLNQQRHRKHLQELAQRHNAEFYLLWFQIDEETAQARVNERLSTAEDKLKDYYQNFRKDVVTHIKKNLQKPTPSKRTIILGGTLPYAKQQKLVLSSIK